MEMDHEHGGHAEQALWADKFDCQEAIHTLYHFLDGELTPDRRQEIQHHLEGCSPCLEAFDFEAELKIIIAKKCRDQVPPALRERVVRVLFEASHTWPGSDLPGGMPDV